MSCLSEHTMVALTLVDRAQDKVRDIGRVHRTAVGDSA